MVNVSLAWHGMVGVVYEAFYKDGVDRYGIKYSVSSIPDEV